MRVTIENGTYRGQAVQGTFELVQDYTPFGGDVETRRNGRGGLGFVKIRHNGQLVGCVKNVGKVTVPALGVGYTVLNEVEQTVPASESVARFLESAGWTERQVSQTPTQAVEEDEDYSEVKTIVQVMLDIDELEAQLAQLSGKDRDRVRKTLGRRKEKLAALTA